LFEANVERFEEYERMKIIFDGVKEDKTFAR
jgi:hypothetical protein